MGFPTRVGRSGYGPDPINSSFPRDPRKQLNGETTGRLMLWQLGGIGLLSPVAFFIFGYADGTLYGDSHAEAFQPNGGAWPSVGRTSTGLYTFGYLATYPDEQGVARPLVLRGGVVVGCTSQVRHGQVELNGDKHSGLVHVCDLTGSAADGERLFVVLW